jgi:hypothetical protein
MVYKLLTDLTVFIHLAFILFVVLGGFLVLRWRKSVYAHIPAALWGAAVEYFGLLCPLTPLENYFRNKAGYLTYKAGFIEQYITPLIYPENLKRNIQFILGSLVILINIVIYLLIIIKNKRKQLKIKSN